MATKKEPKQRQIASAGNGGWPVRLAMCESAIRKQDEYVFKHAPLFVDRVVEATAAHVEKNRQTDALDFLCNQRCPRRDLLYLLGMCENRGVTNSLKMTGHDSEELRKTLRELRECATSVLRINGHAVREEWGGTEFGKFLEMAKVKRSAIADFLELTISLREYASLVEHAARYLGGKSDFYLRLAKALLAGFVHQQTNEYHDPEVAKLLSVMLGPEYGEVEHRVWRSNYKKQFTHYRPDPVDSPSLRAKKTLLECEAAIFYRMDVLHSGTKHVRQEGFTALRLSDLA
jgi:hypothetical protein